MASSTTSDGYFEQTILALGFKNPVDFLLKFALPILGSVILFFFVTVFVLVNLPFYIPYLVLVMGFGFIFVYPVILFESKKSNINENLHLFITYAGTISTVGIQRNILFKKLAEKKDLFGEISEISRKINYFSKAWNLGYAQTCRKISKVVPSPIFADFLDRFAIMMDLGQNLEVFIRDEQTAVMDDFAVEYKKNLASIQTLQEIFVSLTMALGFMMAIGLIMPLISGTPIDTVVKLSLLGVIVLDFLMLGFVKVFIPEDKIVLGDNNRAKEHLEIIKLTYILVPVSVFFLLLVFYFYFFPFIVNVAIGITPLFFIGVLAQKLETSVFKVDRVFPSFIRALGSIIDIKSGAIRSSLSAIRVHDFGAMNELIVGLYRRLKTGNDKHACWEKFGEESGSFLIYQFSTIFAESTYLGGRAERIGELVSDNFTKLLSLRRLRIQMSAGLRGALYGSLVGFTLSAYMAAELTQLLANLFTQPFEAMEQGEISGVLSGVLPTGALDVDIEVIAIYLGIMVIIHSIVSAIIIKIVDGGSMYSAFFDFVLLVWIGAIISVVLPFALRIFLPGLQVTSSIGI